jgi:L-alanine-DL-glutamate epimerase-like enolase superfamily enzyme
MKINPQDTYGDVPLCFSQNSPRDLWLRRISKLQTGVFPMLHPDHLVIGGCLELKKTSDMAAKYSVGMMVHSNAMPIGYAAAAQAIATCENFLAMEWHQPQPAWHKDLCDKWDLVVKGYIPVSTGPGLGIDHVRPDQRW